MHTVAVSGTLLQRWSSSLTMLMLPSWQRVCRQNLKFTSAVKHVMNIGEGIQD